MQEHSYKYIYKLCLPTGAMKVLKEELVATTVPPESSEAYRLNLSYGLFYKVHVFLDVYMRMF